MTQAKKQTIIIAIVGLLIAVAYIPTLFFWMSGTFPPLPLAYLRNFIYIGLLGAWGLSVYYRIIQRQARNHLMVIATLMVIWVAVRSIKYYFVEGIDVTRWLWYSYYIPILLIPTFCLLIALSLGKPEQHRLPQWIRGGVILPAFALLALVLSNDLHHFVFAFPDGAPWTDADFSYQLGYWLVAAWVLLTGVLTLVIFIAKCRVPQSRKILWLPFIPLALLLTYTVLYVAGWPALNLFARDMTIVFCLLFTATLESCIQIGLIKSNSKYPELFSASSIAARIINEQGDTLLASANAPQVAKETLLQAVGEPLLLPNGIRLSATPLSCGYLMWQEDISELLSSSAELEKVNEALKNKTAILEREFQTRRKHRALVEKNRLYNKLTKQTEDSLSNLSELNAQLTAANDPQKIGELVARIAILTSYLKRRNNLIFIAEENDLVPVAELEYCMREMGLNLKLLGIDCSLQTTVDCMLPTSQIIFLYDQFASFVRASLANLKMLHGSIFIDVDQLAMNLLVVSEGDLSVSADNWQSVTRESENEWALTCVAPREGEGA